MNLRHSPLRTVVSVAASASIMATSLVAIAAPVITTAATTCVEETGSTTVYPALVAGQPAYQASVTAQPAWPTGQKLGCDVNLRATGSGSGKTDLITYVNAAPGAGTRRDLAASSSPLSGAESPTLMAFQVGGDAMVIAVRNDNPVTSIKMAEVTAIYNGNISTWDQISAPNGKTGAIVVRSRIAGSGTRDDMNRLFKMDRGTVDAAGHKVSCSAGFTTCEPDVIDASGQARLTTSAEEADAVCNSSSAIVYTSLANLQLYGPGTAGCDAAGHTLKALNLQLTDYATFTGATLNNPLSLPSSGAFVAPSVSSAAVSGTYPAKRALFLTMGKVAKLATKYGTGNGTGWTDDLNTTKAFDLVNYMGSTQGQSSVAGVGFINISVPSKQLVPDADVDLNGGIGLTDIGQITGRWNRTDTIPGSIRADVDNNGGVGLSDIGKITGAWGTTGFVAP